MPDFLQPNGLQHPRPPYPSPTPRAYSNSYPLSWWCHPTILSSVVTFSCLQFSQHQGLFQWVSSSHKMPKVLEFQLQHQSFNECSGLISFRMDWLVSLQSKGLSRLFSNTTVQNHPFFQCSAFFIVQLSHPWMTTGKTIALTRQTFVGIMTYP